METYGRQGRVLDIVEQENVQILKMLSVILPVSENEWEEAAFLMMQWAADNKTPTPDAQYIKKKYLRMISRSEEDKPPDLRMTALSIWAKTQIEKESQITKSKDSSMDGMNLVSK